MWHYNDVKKKNYSKLIIAAMKSVGTYRPALDLQIRALADALTTLDLARADIASLDKTTVTEISRYGVKLVPHPAFKIQRDATDTITRLMKQLGLTPAAIQDGSSGDEMRDFLSSLREKDSDDL